MKNDFIVAALIGLIASPCVAKDHNQRHQTGAELECPHGKIRNSTPEVITTPEFETLINQYKGLKVLPFVPAIRATGNQFVFISGIIGFPDDYDPTKKYTGSIAEQTEQIFKILSQTLAASGLKLSDVVSIHKYLTNMEDHEAVVAVMQKYFTDHFPTSTTIEVKRLVPLGFGIEIEAIAVTPERICK